MSGRPEDGAVCESSCLTCGDIAVQVRVVSLLPAGLALVDTGSGTEEISVALVAARVGDTVLVHAGEAIVVIEDGIGDDTSP
ncbi:HypC/HybG/HupF family hydrogenase formation chaperone [Nonomuraea jiangxiensis]|uniref:Hydrogenase expression/formation protein HypC n=1 Tax=Nonomuraea jiangxiensis TaxID=633440 RepID=A0A1G8T8K5_9ACTN|nr:HypC/HybG/HupF family hydrogenase formation chaperone [Nonomuraea jiangxiensis]SDJ37727.1 hydrogenase expression/formation protein HypC [Nonomuraea jiangxiensis]